ncbi:MAG TPA: TlpA disulfide reductase family protein [Salinimicrobium sp.]|nr:TlpA disulfide reductase family protein [Salinimicrobium sp.]
MKEDGSFADTLDLPEEGYYTLVVGNEITSLYLEPESSNSVNLNTAEFDESLKYSGDNAAENNYLAQKFLLSEKIGINPRDMATMSEDSLIMIVDKNEQQYLALLNKNKEMDSAFVALESKGLQYQNRLNREMYGLYSQNKYYESEGEAPSTAKLLGEEIDLDNAEDYENYSDYQQLVSLDFYKQTSLLNPEDTTSYTDKAFAYLENVKSENIKNDLLRQIAYRIRPGAENNEEIYERVMAVSSDEEFKDELSDKFEKIQKLQEGNPSPTFTYENHAGGETALTDLQGKYVYIDVWATWCGPCLAQIPALKEVEEEYKGKNIHFVSLSIDTDEDYEKWKKMVNEKELGGIQVIADNAWESDFVEDYAIDGIPRFILLDPEGNIVSADAPRPTMPELRELFESEGI